MSFQSPNAFDALRYPYRSHLGALPNALCVSQGWQNAGEVQRLTSTPLNLSAHTIDHNVIGSLGADFCLQQKLLPLRRIGGGAILACADPDLAKGVARLRALRDLSFAHAPSADITATLLAEASTELKRRAEEKRPLAASCRGLRPVSALTLCSIIFTLIAITLLAPNLVLRSLTVLALIGLVAATALKLLGLVALTRSPPAQPRVLSTEPRLRPKITLLLPLLHEPKVAHRLVHAIEALEYPRFALEVLILIEADDHITKAALDNVTLARHFRVIEVPEGRLRTKPRAMNYALPFATGEIIGIYDAEDHPEADQLLKVAAGFAQAPAEVACLQGRLDYYNARTNILARCFALDYAAWFRVVLPALITFDLPVPLGGTTLFLRRNIIEELGGWDAHNVTEDAELGMSLYRRGYRVRLIDSTTYEEANCRALPWVKQRSRWLKGYLVTWLVMMRHPRQLFRDLGWKGFATFQMIFAGTILNCATMPILWAFLSGTVTGHAVLGLNLSPLGVTAMVTLLVSGQIITIAMFFFGSLRREHAHLLPWIPILNFYFLLTVPAVYKAIWETLRAPHHWDKTEHGVYPVEPAP
jgi:cellulose synthase/poly-beta-1,6-N-acetylglucosamine synthase-like glycosyltransferase